MGTYGFFRFGEKKIPACSELKLKRFLSAAEFEAQALYDKFSSIML